MSIMKLYCIYVAFIVMFGCAYVMFGHLTEWESVKPPDQISIDALGIYGDIQELCARAWWLGVISIALLGVCHLAGGFSRVRPVRFAVTNVAIAGLILAVIEVIDIYRAVNP